MFYNGMLGVQSSEICFIMVCLNSLENELPFIMVRDFGS